MKSATKVQFSIILGAIILIVLLLFANTKLPSKAQQAKEVVENNHSIDETVELAKQKLSSEQKQTLDQLEQSIKASSNKNDAYNKLISYWATNLNQPLVAAFYSENLAQINLSEQNWSDAGNRYLVSTRFVDEHQKIRIIEKAIECFEKAIAINPNNIEAKISLASCYVESPEPMKGISMLREIEKTDSNNVNLQLNLAYFSQRSGQYEKAISRFEKVLKLKPEFIEAYLYIADSYERLNDIKKTIENLEKYSSLVDDNAIKIDIQKYINELSHKGTTK